MCLKFEAKEEGEVKGLCLSHKLAYSRVIPREERGPQQMLTKCPLRRDTRV